MDTKQKSPYERGVKIFYDLQKTLLNQYGNEKIANYPNLVVAAFSSFLISKPKEAEALSSFVRLRTFDQYLEDLIELIDAEIWYEAHAYLEFSKKLTENAYTKIKYLFDYGDQSLQN